MRDRAGGRVYFFATGARRFFFAVGAPLPGAGQVRRNPMGRGPASRGLRFFAAGCCRCAALFFLLRVRGKFTHSLAAGRLRASTAERHPGSAARLFFFCCGCASSGGARLFFCCGCAARLFFFFAAGARRVFFCCGCAASSLTHSLPAASEHPLQKDIQGPRRVYFVAAGARAHSLTHSLPAARRAPTAKKHTQKKNTGSMISYRGSNSMATFFGYRWLPS